MASGGPEEHRVQIRTAPHGGAGRAGKASAAAPEMRLNRFVRFVVLIERLGNALGTLAFTWATVVLLGGYSKDLSLDNDFWYATAIVFLEATRMFTRNNRLDYQLFFNTRGAFRPVGWNGLIAILCFFDVMVILLKKHYMSYMVLLLMAVILATGRFLSGLKLHICKSLHRATSLWSPLVAILLMVPPLSDSVTEYIYVDEYDQYQVGYKKVGPSTRWIVFTTLLVPMLLVTISRLRFKRIIKLVDSALGSRQVFWRRAITNLCMIAALGMQVFMLYIDQAMNFSGVLLIQICALAVVSFGNFQIPAAVLRIVLALLSLHHKYKENEKNLEASLKIFYGMVLGQGILYVIACMLEFFSFIPRRSLVHGGGFRGQWGVESVNLYYAYALEKCMQEGVLAPKKISLSNFAMDSLNSGSSKNQLYGIRMMHNFLQREPTKAQLLPKLSTSTQTVTRIIRMLDWRSPKDTTIRLYAAKVTTELAKDLRVATFPGTMQLLSALLDTDSRPRKGNPLLDTDDEQEQQDQFVNTDVVENQEKREDSQEQEHHIVRDVTDNNQEEREDSQEQEHHIVRDVTDNNHGKRRDPLQETDNLLKETQTHSTQQACIEKQKSYILKCWRWISEFRSIPKEQLSTDHDLLPALAMSIIDTLASCDQENSVEICNAADLIPKIIGFTSYTCGMNNVNTEAQQKVMLKSSLKVLQRLTSIGGEIGVTLRYKISKHPFLLRNLAEIFGDNKSNLESIKLAAGILRNIAIDGTTRQEIGHIQLIITMLMQVFLNAEGSTNRNSDHLLRKVAGQALAMLTTESVDNCLVVLKEPEFINKLKTMFLVHDNKYTYVVASILRNLCMYARPELSEPDMKDLSHTLREVLERIMDAEGAELEILIGLSSQICKVIPEDFTRELDAGEIKWRFAKRLADALNANKIPSAHCPGMRRVILEQIIYLTECSSHYADCFNKCGMTEALFVVEKTLSKVENYRLYLGDMGFMEYRIPISAIVARAKELTVCG